MQKNLTKPVANVPLNNTLKQKNNVEGESNDKFTKNSMEMLKSKSHMFIFKKSDSKRIIRFQRNSSLEPNNYTNVQK